MLFGEFDSIPVHLMKSFHTDLFDALPVKQWMIDGALFAPIGELVRAATSSVTAAGPNSTVDGDNMS